MQSGDERRQFKEKHEKKNETKTDNLVNHLNDNRYLERNRDGYFTDKSRNLSPIVELREFMTKPIQVSLERYLNVGLLKELLAKKKES